MVNHSTRRIWAGGIFLLNVVATFCFVWASGRFGLPTLFFVQVLWFPLILIVNVFLTSMLLNRGWRLLPRLSVIFGITLGVSLLLNATKGLLWLYMMGVQAAIYAEATPMQLNSLPATVGVGSVESASRRVTGAQVPAFLRKLFVHRQMTCLVTGTPASEGTAVIVTWRDVRFSFGLAVGQSFKKTDSVLFHRELSPGVHLIAKR